MKIPIQTRLKRILPITIGLALILFIIISAIDSHSFNRSFYKRVYGELGTAETIGISQDDLDHATEVLLDYLQDKRGDIDVTVTLQTGEREPMFNQREIDHMVDVKDLYQGAMLVRWISLGVVVLGLLLMLRLYGLRLTLRHLANGYKFSLGIFLFVVLAIGLLFWVDFERFWTIFHQIFFSNDLWILDPATDRMILMVPSYFFSTLIMNIVRSSLVYMVLTGVLLHVFGRHSGPRYTGTTDGFG